MGEEDSKPPRRFEVVAIDMGFGPAKLQDLADGLEWELNKVAQRGVRVQQLQFIAERGAILIIDTEPVASSVAVPISLSSLAELLTERPDAGVSLPLKLQEVLVKFAPYAEREQLHREPEREYKELKAYLNTALRLESTSDLRLLIEGCNDFLEEHRKSCSDVDGCNVVHVVSLVCRALEERVKDQLQ